MPRELIQAAQEPFHPKVGWAADRDVQIGIEVEGQRSIFWTLFEHEDRERLGREVRRIQNMESSTDEEIGCVLLNVLDVAATGPSVTGSYAGLWATLDRQGCNRLIRVLRRARDSAFGADA